LYALARSLNRNLHSVAVQIVADQRATVELELSSVGKGERHREVFRGSLPELVRDYCSRFC
jgi:hypothetical protein